MDRTLALLGLAFASILVGGYVLLSINHLPTDGFVVFVSGPLVSTIVGAVVSHQVGQVRKTVKRVEVATDGLLSGRLNSLDDQLADASKERKDIALVPVVLPVDPPVSVTIGPVDKPGTRGSAGEQPAPSDGTDLPVS